MSAQERIGRGDALSMWVIYDHPTDYPEWFVARQWLGEEPTGKAVFSNDLEVLRQHMRDRGLGCLTRMPDDDPVIVEVWL